MVLERGTSLMVPYDIYTVYLRYRLYTIETRSPLIYLGEVDICILSWPLEPEEKKNDETCLKAEEIHVIIKILTAGD